VKYPMGISIEAELIMRRVSIINIKAWGIACARVGLPYAFFSWTCPLVKTRKFPSSWVRKCAWGCQDFLTICCFFKYSHNVLGLKCKTFIVRKYIIVILHFHCVCVKKLELNGWLFVCQGKLGHQNSEWPELGKKSMLK
jgi:hypothetical protein